jgi:hypothetical protein
MTTPDDALLPCPGCIGPAFYVDTVLCDHCSFEAKTPEDWNRRAGQAHAAVAEVMRMTAPKRNTMRKPFDTV